MIGTYQTYDATLLAEYPCETFRTLVLHDAEGGYRVVVEAKRTWDHSWRTLGVFREEDLRGVLIGLGLASEAIRSRREFAARKAAEQAAAVKDASKPETHAAHGRNGRRPAR